MITTMNITKVNNVPERLEKRLRENERKNHFAKVCAKNEQEDLLKLLSKGPKRPRETLPQIQKKIDDLEWERTINSVTLSKEKEILRKIIKLEKLKHDIHAYESHDKQVKEQKQTINDLREFRKQLNSKAAAIRTEITANKLGCEPEELVGMKISLPENMIGQVIGKKGKHVKELSEKTQVEIQVNSSGGEVQLLGTLRSLEAAASEVSKIVSKVQDKIDVSTDLRDYLTTKNIVVIDDIRKRYPDVHISVQRMTTQVLVSGNAEDVTSIKKELKSSCIMKKEVQAPTMDIAAIVGKQGVTIERLVTAHQAAITIEQKAVTKTSCIEVLGPKKNVNEAAAEIEDMLANEKQVVELLSINLNAKNLLMLDRGAGIRELFKKVNEKARPNGESGIISLNFDESNVAIKGKAKYMSAAKELIANEIRQVESDIVRVSVDPFVIPAIIGKGGQSIKKLKQGNNVNIEIDRDNQEIIVCGLNKTEVESVVGSIKRIIKENQVERINVDSAQFETQKRNIVQQKARDISNLVFLDFDKNNSQVILRGEPEKLKNATEAIRSFLAQNYKEELQATPEDIQSLLRGGKNSKVEKLAKELRVKLNCDRDLQVIFVSGETDKVIAASKKIKQLLHGGDGVVVRKVVLNRQLLGVIIGKNGKRMADLKSKHPAVFISTTGGNTAILRGPEEETEVCRIDILNMIATSRSTETVLLTKAQHDAIKNSDVRKRINQRIPVHISIAESEVKVRGCPGDVQHAVAFLTEVWTKTYESRLLIDISVYSKIRDTLQEPFHFERIEAETNTKLKLDESAGAVVIRGKNSNVKAAKRELLKLLEFLQPLKFSFLNIHSSSLSTFGQASFLAKISADSGAFVQLDRDLCSILVFSSSEDKVQKAVEILNAKMKDFKKLTHILQLEDSEDWILSEIIGKKGSKVKSLRRETGCNIEIDSTELTVVASSDKEDNMNKCRAKLEQIVDTARRECVFIDIPQQHSAAFVGKSGAHVKEFQKTHSVEARFKGISGKLRLSGNEQAVLMAKEALLQWIAARERAHKHGTRENVIRIQEDKIPAVIGSKGSVIQGLQTEFGCRIEIDRSNNTLSLRGGSAEQREAAVVKIKAIASGESFESTLAQRSLSDDRPALEKDCLAAPSDVRFCPKNDPEKTHCISEYKPTDTEFPPLATGSEKTDASARKIELSWAKVLDIHPAKSTATPSANRVSIENLLDDVSDRNIDDISCYSDDDNMKYELEDLKKQIVYLREELKGVEENAANVAGE